MELKSLAKHSFIYAASSIMTQVINLLMVPVFTRNMSQAQFGEYSLLISIQTLLSIIITLGIFSGMNRFIYELKDPNRTKNIALTFSLAWGIAMCLISLFISRFLLNQVLPDYEGVGTYLNFLVVSSVLMCLISIYISYYTMMLKSKMVSVINLSRVILMFLFSTYFIMLRKEGVHGALVAQICAYAAVLIALMVYDKKRLRFVIDWHSLKIMLKYGAGLMPGQASAWIYTLIDRYFIKVLMGFNQVAIYSMGYRIGMIMDPLLISPFKSVFTSFKYKTYQGHDAKERFKIVYVYYNFLGLLCVFGLSIFAKPAIALLSTEQYLDAYIVVPLIVLSYYLYGLGEFYSLGIHIRNKSIYDSYILGVGAIINILLNLALIPIFGIMGAALATIISYLGMNILYFIIGRRYLDLGLSYFEPLKGLAIVLPLYMIYFAGQNMIENMLLQLLFSTLLCLLFILLSIFAGVIPKAQTKELIAQFVRKIGLGRGA